MIFLSVTGIICEYNPLHLGHKKQFDIIRSACGEDERIVCLMSGNFVQRGAPAIVDKSIRAKAAVLAGADLVLELPVTVSLSSAEGFAAGGVGILSPLCQKLCFGAEDADHESLLSCAQALLFPAFPEKLRIHLDAGKSFPVARQAALTDMGIDSTVLSKPNNILAVEYYKAILSQHSLMEPRPITRAGSYHAELADPENPSATALRSLMKNHTSWEDYVPREAADCFRHVPLHTLHAGERAILGKLRTMTDEEFESLPYGSEGLWRKFMHAARQYATVEEILTAVKSKRYTRTRLDRMLMCAFLGITDEMLKKPAPYVRVLAFNDRGREILNNARKTGMFLNAGEKPDDPYWEFERRIGDLYGLFADSNVEAPGAEAARRIFYHKA